MVLGVERAALAVVREPSVDIVVPVYNEELDLEHSVRRLRAYLDACFPFHANVTIADNASTDDTQAIGERLAATVPGVSYMRLSDKGRGRALAAAWLLSKAEVVGYMDVDLSTDLGALLPLVAPLISGHSDVAVGSRLAPGSRVRRGAKRELISRCYNALLRVALGARFRDAQCGFKAIRTETARRLVPRTENRSWFFDTELLVLAQRAGLRIHEVPVDWDDDPDSRVSILPTALEDLGGVWRLMRSGPSRIVRFATVGIASTLAYGLIYLALRELAAPWLANLVALIVTAVANTAANRRFTFGVQGRRGAATDYAAGLTAFLIALVLTTGAGDALRHLMPGAPHLLEVAAMTGANLIATLCRYAMFRGWMDSRLQVVAANST
ncbi:MAG: glycosyltransferase [Chloroflexi bacterium]|nr:MAG: glycosyltransferase [Chloroflexota bacterium]